MVGGQRKNQSLRESITDLRDCYSPLKCWHRRHLVCVYERKKKQLKVIYDCAKLYKENLSAKCVLFITAEGDMATTFETLFLPQNFKHLTGVRSKLSGADFFGLVTRNKLSPSEIELSDDGTTDLKLDILPQLMNIHKTARMVGDYDYSRSLFIADRIAGTVTAAMGFIHSMNYYLPKSALKSDVRDITLKTTRRRIIAIFVKNRYEELYSKLTYLASGLQIEDKIFDSIKSKIDLSEQSKEY